MDFKTEGQTRPIMNLCLEAYHRTGSRLTKRWLDQDGLDVEGVRTAYLEVEQMDKGKETDRAETETE